MNRLLILGFCVGLIFLFSCGVTLFSSDTAYATSLIGVAPPKSAQNLSSFRSGSNAPLVRWFFSREEFKNYQKILSTLGFQSWKTIHYNSNDPSTFLDKVVFAGFPNGSDATAVAGEKIERSGKSSVHVYYDTTTGEFIAIKAYGSSRITNH